MRWVIAFILAPFVIVGFFAAVVLLQQGLGLVPAETVGGEIVMTEMRFVPNRIEAKAGQPFTVTFVNRGAQRHDFALAALHMPGFQPVETMAEPGQRVTVTLRIDTPGQHVFTCTVPGHAAAGMTGVVAVAP